MNAERDPESALPTTVPCPTCKRDVPWSKESPWRPFCSERCKLIDLGAWFAEEHRVPGAEADDSGDLDSDPPIG